MSELTPERLASLRKDIGFSQVQMADAMGVSRRTYIDIETGAVEMRKIHKLAAERAALAAAAFNPSIANKLPYWLRHEIVDVYPHIDQSTG